MESQTDEQTDVRKDRQMKGQMELTKTIYPFGILHMLDV